MKRQSEEAKKEKRKQINKRYRDKYEAILRITLDKELEEIIKYKMSESRAGFVRRAMHEYIDETEDREQLEQLEESGDGFNID